MAALKRLDKRKLTLLFSDRAKSGGCETESESITASAAAQYLVSEFQPLEKKDLAQVQAISEFRKKRYIMLIRPYRKAQAVYRIEVWREGGHWQARSIMTCDFDQAMISL